MRELRTPLARARGLGSAGEGTGHFWHQRVTAVANLPLMLFFIGIVVALTGASYDEVRATLAWPPVSALLGAALVSVFYHMKLGMQIIIEDYIHGGFLKVVFLMLNIFFTFFLAAASLFALIRIVLTG